MTKSLLSLFLLVFFASAAMFAQHQVTGKIVDETGEPIPGVNVVEKENTMNGTITNFDGIYNLTVGSAQSTLTVSFIGFKLQEVPIAGQSVVNITMEADITGLDEVVVTALGIERDKKSLGYAMQEIDGTALVDTKEPNLANTLSGKVSGLQIVRGAGGPGGSSKIILRGNNSLTGSNQPLIVVDGMPINNFTDGAQVDMYGTANGRDFGSGIGDLNPDDIATMSVLKGASAAALYGSRAGNGVILITTKKGKQTKGAGISINSSVGFESLLTQPELQDVFGQGLLVLTIDYPAAPGGQRLRDKW